MEQKFGFARFMKNRRNSADEINIPTVLEFADLIPVTRLQRAVTLGIPFVCTALYFFSLILAGGFRRFWR